MSESSAPSQRTALEALGTALVQFPPARLTDCVMLHRGAAFRVRKYVLMYHSAYFRTYLEQLADGQRAYTAEECGAHSDVTHCVRLPHSVGKVEADVSDFRLFLCHLYFARHYSCVPYRVDSHIELTADPPPAVSFNYPQSECFSDIRSAPSSWLNLRPCHSVPVYDAVMSLAHYTDCANAAVARGGQLTGHRAGRRAHGRPSAAVERAVAVHADSSEVRPETRHASADAGHSQALPPARERPRGGVGQHPKAAARRRDVRAFTGNGTRCQKADKVFYLRPSALRVPRAADVHAYISG